LSSSDPLAAFRPGSAPAKNSATATAPESSAQAAQSAEAVSTPSAASSVAEPDPEMDFPARVVHLKIENDTLRSKLDKLEPAP